MRPLAYILTLALDPLVHLQMFLLKWMWGSKMQEVAKKADSRFECFFNPVSKTESELVFSPSEATMLAVFVTASEQAHDNDMKLEILLSSMFRFGIAYQMVRDGIRSKGEMLPWEK